MSDLCFKETDGDSVPIKVEHSCQRDHSGIQREHVHGCADV